MPELEGDRIFAALTRPQMFAGVTYSAFVINAVITTELFLVTKSPGALLAGLALHAVAYVACLHEPRMLDLWIARLVRCPRTPDHARWRCNSYGA